MERIMRTIKYLTIEAEKIIGIAVGGSVIFTIYMWLIGIDRSFGDMLSRFPMAIGFFGSIMILSYGMVNVSAWVNIMIGYGCKRKEAGIGFVYMQLICALQMILITALCYLVAPAGVFAGDIRLTLVMAHILLVFAGTALIMGMLVSRFGKIAYIIFVIICAFCGGIVGGVFVNSEIGLLLEYSWVNGVFSVPNLIISIGIYAVCGIIFYIGIRKRVVK